MKQDISKLYKQLSQLEADKDRFLAMQDRRKELLEYLMRELNPKAYEVTVIELGVELADIYSAMFDVQYEHYNRIGKPPKKAEAQVMNGHGLKSIEYGKSTVDIILKKDDKYIYAQAIMNQYLSVARIQSKLYEKDEKLILKNLEESYRTYQTLERFMKDFMKHSAIQDVNDLSPGMLEPYKMMLEMVELLPVKISKLNAMINAHK